MLYMNFFFFVFLEFFLFKFSPVEIRFISIIDEVYIISITYEESSKCLERRFNIMKLNYKIDTKIFISRKVIDINSNSSKLYLICNYVNSRSIMEYFILLKKD